MSESTIPPSVSQAEVYAVEVELDLPAPSIPVIKQILCGIDGFCITIFGYNFCTTPSWEIPDTLCHQIERLLMPLNALLATLNPFFLMVDVFLAVQDCILAIPEAIISLSPDPLLECVQGLIDAIIAILCMFYPPFAFPAIIASVVDFLIQVVTCIQTNIQALCDTLDRINNLDELLRGDPAFADTGGALLASARTNLECKIGTSIGGLLSICALIEILNAFIQVANTLAGQELMPSIACPTFGFDTPCDEIVALLQQIIDSLTAFSAIIPDCPPA